MIITFTNDWRYLFSKFSTGKVFSLIYLAYTNIEFEDPELEKQVNGLSISLLGLGVRIRRKK